MKEYKNNPITLLLSAALALAVTPLLADEDYEWDPTWGLHDEEWYDPSDWFNEDGIIDIEDTGTWAYDEDYYAEDFWYDDVYYADYGTDYSDFHPSVVYYTWVPAEETWRAGDEIEETGQQAATKTGEEREEATETGLGASQGKESASGKKAKMKKKDVITMRGEIVDVTKLTPKGADQAHTFVILEPAEGKQVIVDLGAEEASPDMKLEKGNKIQVRGPRAKADGRYILVAQQVGQIQEKEEQNQ